MNLIHFYLLSPLHTGGTTQEGNLVGIARESHTTLPYIPSSTIRGKIRSLATEENLKFKLFGNEIDKGAENLEQGDIWIGDGSILWLPVPSLSHGVVWITSPLLLRRWTRLTNPSLTIPPEYSCSFKKANTNVYLKDAILKVDDLKDWSNWQSFIPKNSVSSGINKVLVLPNQHCTTLIQMSLWRQVKIKLDEHKSVDGGFRYEEAIPPDTLMYFPWGITSQANGTRQQSQADFKQLLADNDILQIGGQESLGRGFVQQW
ncbi:type III-B CRISPR module RAMP protein Cmr4 [Microcystis aeruginosa NIES-298]|jgi:CRISPR-associated protein Cmr4|uniref:CRISPR-associated RAMP protein, Cmr4 family n=3 Tax=Microcystis TaxID=1125 RepID=A0A2H6BUD0_MICAE|nr:type III-B CRISPR module RAMP protein Cmr4 [Microcystis aeruginosa]NCR96739.1 type III-B CRISPR module RAMP protein Cmr4 [Microcystis aeruginosa L311-01]OCY13408.1 MAG: type III-B CRISPR module RAMP protein Cmr4 [Microcystis aeruginosa CACIAM 03]REJ41925.1 MAG: type III-B CRISPR module RAMP protein Cmr4 [Microcystis flos-aquae TF09]TRU05484.1 MAG: type III-B CRISPR module RAMP protein Cmr4 [Microcystis aeruginosa Ma_MB_F_20061100_S19D]TRU17672.1 MAG: type III-B CRISPR module RAMP protein Cm